MKITLRDAVDAVHLTAAGGAAAVTPFGHDYDRYIAAHCPTDAPGRLVSIAASPSDWEVWEVHPAGDEVVIVLEGHARFTLDHGDRHEVVELKAGDAVINPAGVPHTADALTPFVALYITPAPGTEHRTRTTSRRS